MPSDAISGKLALVTGATGGIGKATCIALGKMGCDVAIHYNTAEEKAEALVKELRGLGVKAAHFQADMSKYDEVRIASYDISVIYM
jgi:3-oxoacyl-[acyl-carrier protein] reductase